MVQKHETPISWLMLLLCVESPGFRDNRMIVSELVTAFTHYGRHSLTRYRPDVLLCYRYVYLQNSLVSAADWLPAPGKLTAALPARGWGWESPQSGSLVTEPFTRWCIDYTAACRLLYEENENIPFSFYCNECCIEMCYVTQNKFIILF
jgi:hypothetical protein